MARHVARIEYVHVDVDVNHICCFREPLHLAVQVCRARAHVLQCELLNVGAVERLLLERVGVAHAHLDDVARRHGGLQTGLEPHPREALPGGDGHGHPSQHAAQRSFGSVEIAVGIDKDHRDAQRSCGGSGMLQAAEHSGPTARPLRVAMVFIDAHGDFNTPETTLSGMLGGMPVAIAAGQCLTRMRLKAGLEPAVPTRHIVEMCVRDTDPLEQELLDRSDIQQLTLEDVRTRSANLHREMKRLSETTDVIYIHIDMDVLDPREVPGHPLAVPGGPTSIELAAALTEMFKYEKVAALGVASTPFDDRDKAGLSRQAAYNLILGAVQGVQQRTNE